MSVPAFTTIPNRIWMKCHEDTRFARRLRQVFNQIEAIFPSHYRDRERDGDISCIARRIRCSTNMGYVSYYSLS